MNLSIFGEGERREGRARELLVATRSGEGLEVFCPPMPEVGDQFCPPMPEVGDQVGLDNKGEGEPRTDGDACAS